MRAPTRHHCNIMQSCRLKDAITARCIILNIAINFRSWMSSIRSPGQIWPTIYNPMEWFLVVLETIVVTFKICKPPELCEEIMPHNKSASHFFLRQNHVRFLEAPWPKKNLSWGYCTRKLKMSLFKHHMYINTDLYNTSIMATKWTLNVIDKQSLGNTLWS